jgi:signal transduction histidine kinase
MPKNKSYIPSSRYNPVVQAKKIQDLNLKIEKLYSMYSAISKANDTHIAQLGNFAKHDIKNAIQSMDAILNTIDVSEFDQETINSLSARLDLIRTVMDNFSKVVPHSPNGTFTINQLLIAVELLNRAEMESNNINIKYDYDRNSTKEIKMPFQDIIMIVNNLLLNSRVALETIEEKFLTVEGEVLESTFSITVLDNGIRIPVDHNDKIFDYGYSTTNGSGVGLYHARFLCENFMGSIKLFNEDSDIFTKKFVITLPTTKQ